MKAYLDSSVILRHLLGEPEPLAEFSRINHAYCSRLVRLECLRTLDRLRLMDRLDDSQVAQARQTLFSFFERVEWIPLSEPILALAESSFPTKLGSLDAIHLSSTILIAKKYGEPVTMATHDAELALAAKAGGLSVLGA